MQTKQQIQQLLDSMGVRPNKRLGQNFLIDLNLIKLLINSADIKNSDCVIEVGCGTGSLTEAIAQHNCKTIAVEVDQTLAKIAKKQLADMENVQILQTDILENKNTITSHISQALNKARENTPGRLMLVANLPYSVASPVMINLTIAPVFVDCMYVTVQKEVALRMTASAGNNNYGTLSIILNAVGQVKIIRVLKPSVFWPKPQVDSAMVSFIRDNEKVRRIKNISLFSEVVRLFMQHRRKMLKACCKFAPPNLAKITNWPEIFTICSVDPKARPEKLTPEDYIAIANLCHKNLKNTAKDL